MGSSSLDPINLLVRHFNDLLHCIPCPQVVAKVADLIFMARSASERF